MADNTKQKTTEEPTSALGNTVGNNMNKVELLEAVLAQTLGLAMHNMVSAQQNAQVLNSTIMAQTCKRILSAKRTAGVGSEVQQAGSETSNKNTGGNSTNTKK